MDEKQILSKSSLPNLKQCLLHYWEQILHEVPVLKIQMPDSLPHLYYVYRTLMYSNHYSLFQKNESGKKETYADIIQ